MSPVSSVNYNSCQQPGGYYDCSNYTVSYTEGEWMTVPDSRNTSVEANGQMQGFIPEHTGNFEAINMEQELNQIVPDGPIDYPFNRQFYGYNCHDPTTAPQEYQCKKHGLDYHGQTEYSVSDGYNAHVPSSCYNGSAQTQPDIYYNSSFYLGELNHCDTYQKESCNFMTSSNTPSSDSVMTSLITLCKTSADGGQYSSKNVNLVSDKVAPSAPKNRSSVARRNARERKRIKNVNQAFDDLRKRVPCGGRNNKISKVETLRSAIEYIKALQDLAVEKRKLRQQAEEKQELENKPNADVSTKNNVETDA